MTKKLPKRGLPPMHPGELLREEILPALARPKTEIAKLLGVSRQTLYDILDEAASAHGCGLGIRRAVSVRSSVVCRWP
jgi:hypothetical protein